MTTTITARLTMATLFLTSLRRLSFQKLTESRMTISPCFSSCVAGRKSSAFSCKDNGFLTIFPPSLQFDPGINEFIYDIHDNVDENHQRGKEDGRSHDHHVIPV